MSEAVTGPSTAARRPDDLGSLVGAVVAAVLDEPGPVGPGFSLADCDSIDLVEVAERVETRLRPAHPAVAIDDEALARCGDVGDLVDLVAASLSTRG